MHFRRLHNGQHRQSPFYFELFYRTQWLSCLWGSPIQLCVAGFSQCIWFLRKFQLPVHLSSCELMPRQRNHSCFLLSVVLSLFIVGRSGIWPISPRAVPFAAYICGLGLVYWPILRCRASPANRCHSWQPAKSSSSRNRIWVYMLKGLVFSPSWSAIFYGWTLSFQLSRTFGSSYPCCLLSNSYARCICLTLGCPSCAEPPAWCNSP